MTDPGPPNLDGLVPEDVVAGDLKRAAAVSVHLLADPPDLEAAGVLLDEVHEHNRCRPLARSILHLLGSAAPELATAETRQRLRDVAWFLGYAQTVLPIEDPYSEGTPMPPQHHELDLEQLPPELQAYVDGIQLECVEALHSATLGNSVAVERVIARAADPRLTAFTLAFMAEDILRETGRSTEHLARLTDRIEGETP